MEACFRSGLYRKPLANARRFYEQVSSFGSAQLNLFPDQVYIKKPWRKPGGFMSRFSPATGWPLR